MLFQNCWARYKILIMQNVNLKLGTREYFQMSAKQFHSSNPDLCPLSMRSRYRPVIAPNHSRLRNEHKTGESWYQPRYQFSYIKPSIYGVKSKSIHCLSLIIPCLPGTTIYHKPQGQATKGIQLWIPLCHHPPTFRQPLKTKCRLVGKCK